MIGINRYGDFYYRLVDSCDYNIIYYSWYSDEMKFSLWSMFGDVKFIIVEDV